MPISVTCLCGKSIEIPDKFAGKTGRCRTCGSALIVPPLKADSSIEPIPLDMDDCAILPTTQAQEAFPQNDSSQGTWLRRRWPVFTVAIVGTLIVGGGLVNMGRDRAKGPLELFRSEVEKARAGGNALELGLAIKSLGDEFMRKERYQDAIDNYDEAEKLLRPAGLSAGSPRWPVLIEMKTNKAFCYTELDQLRLAKSELIRVFEILQQEYPTSNREAKEKIAETVDVLNERIKNK